MQCQKSGASSGIGGCQCQRVCEGLKGGGVGINDADSLEEEAKSKLLLSWRCCLHLQATGNIC